MIINAQDPRIETRPATAADIAAFYDEPPGERLRAWVMDVDGVPSAVGGVSFVNEESPLIFSRLTDRIRPYKFAIFKGAKLLMQYLARMRYPMLAVADPDEVTARNLLAFLGLKLVTLREGLAVYRFNPLKEGR